MAISDRDQNEMIRLAREGKAISKIHAENYPQYEYGEIHSIVYGAGGRSALGLKRMITHRLGKVVNANNASREVLVNEITDLVDELYNNHKANQKDMDAIRKILNS